MSAVLIDPARPADARRIGLILSGWVDETDWMPRIHSRDQDQAHAADLVSRGWVIVAKRCGEVVGFLARDDAEVHALYVAHNARGQGVGKALLERAKQGHDWLGLWTFQANERAQFFYRREGFHELRRTNGADNDEGLPDIRFEWSRDSD